MTKLKINQIEVHVQLAYVGLITEKEFSTDFEAFLYQMQVHYQLGNKPSCDHTCK
jgi:hypothetical protein